MRGIFFLLQTLLTTGKERQSFIGAGWLARLLKLSPHKYKEKLALWILALSPHHFVDRGHRGYKGMSYLAFLQTERRRNEAGRLKLLQAFLRPHLERTFRVIDYGCGPGFLAKHVSRTVDKVYACDISDGVLECARIINPADNLIYLNVRSMDETVANGSIDLVYSFAVIQHITDEAFETLLELCRNKLKEKGAAVFHIPLEVKGWKSEAEWRRDNTIGGRIRWRYSVNCFFRTEKQVTTLLEKHGFASVEIINSKEGSGDFFDDVCLQQLFIAKRK